MRVASVGEELMFCDTSNSDCRVMTDNDLGRMDVLDSLRSSPDSGTFQLYFLISGGWSD
jgi:hypothetical protein